MDFLTQKLPEGVVIENRFYPVHTDFKNWIKIAELLEKTESIDYMCLAEIFSLCYIELPENILEAVGGVKDFFSGGAAESREKRGGIDKQRCFSFLKDGWLIYAAFLSQYGIDLLKEELHWYKFLALFKGLRNDHKLFDVIYFRTVKLSDIKDKDKRRYLSRMKSIYALTDTKSEEEKAFNTASKIAELF